MFRSPVNEEVEMMDKEWIRAKELNRGKAKRKKKSYDLSGKYSSKIN